ncbi:uncharacterized protein G2W53_026877 [Senna tora]|uniref:Uncharacterized protein n=1 Tax=Senna tora TaxID=362788 RepID=A0A834WG25_9FABA|nr:uncharacterized protein G2W53_026877 [Senna tora]
MALHQLLVNEGLVPSSKEEMKMKLSIRSSNRLVHHGLTRLHGIVYFQNAKFLSLRPPY